MQPVDPATLDRARQRFSDLDHVPLGLAVLDAELRILSWNPMMEQLTGFPRDAALGRPMVELNPEWAHAHYPGRLAHLFAGGPPVVFSSLLHPRIVPQAPGAQLSFHVKASAVPDGQGGWWAILSVEDVTVLNRRLVELRDLRDQQESLMREIHHRVKNNLNMVSGLITLQKAQAPGAPASEVLDDLQGRIAAISEIHDVLYHSSDLGVGKTAGYLEALARTLERGLASPGAHALVLDLDPEVVLSTDTTILLGLVQAELMTNALKYGFTGAGSEVLTIRFVVDGPGFLRYELSQTGDRLPADFEPSASKGLGMVLLNAFAKQLGTTLEWSRGSPTRFWLRFAP